MNIQIYKSLSLSLSLYIYIYTQYNYTYCINIFLQIQGRYQGIISGTPPETTGDNASAFGGQHHGHHQRQRVTIPRIICWGQREDHTEDDGG